MQSRFFKEECPEYLECIKHTTRQIILAKKRGDYILMVEFENNPTKTYSKNTSGVSPSLPQLVRLLKGYDKVYHIFKRERDGADKIISVLNRFNIPRRRMRVCGVYASWCVQETVISLAQALNRSKIFVVKNAIASCHNWDAPNAKEKSLNEMCFYDNVQILG